MRMRVVRASGILALLSGMALVAGIVLDPRAAWGAYLIAMVSWLTLALGALALVLIAHLTDATWFIVMRRAAESAASAILLLALLLLPLAFGLHYLYPWLSPERLDPETRVLVGRKAPYLNLPFFLFRAAGYLAIWTVIVVRVRRWANQQDNGTLVGSLRGFSAAGAILLAFSVSFASFDWMMSLTPGWASTIYGVRIWSGGLVAGLALMAVVMGTGTLPITSAHTQALASLLMALVIFWVYLAFSQLLIIWIANEPREIGWYLTRMRGGWMTVGIALGIGHFVVPFVLLLFRRIKCSIPAMARLGSLLVLMHYVDIYWLVAPALRPDSWVPHWTDVAALIAVTSATGSFIGWLSQRHPAVPARDPAFDLSRAYQET